MNPLPLHFWLIDWLKLSEPSARAVCLRLDRALNLEAPASVTPTAEELGTHHAVQTWRDYQLSLSKAQADGLAVPPANLHELALHGEFKRTLLKMKCRSESTFALQLYLVKLGDEAQSGMQESAALLGLLAPIARSWPLDKLPGPALAIQAQELLSGKVHGDAGATLVLLLKRIAATAQAAAHQPELAEFAPSALEQGAALAKAVLSIQGDLAGALANASLFLGALGNVLACWLMLDQAVCAKRLNQRGFASLLHNCRYLHRYELPQVRTAIELLARADRTGLDADPAWF